MMITLEKYTAEERAILANAVNSMTSRHHTAEIVKGFPSALIGKLQLDIQKYIHVEYRANVAYKIWIDNFDPDPDILLNPTKYIDEFHDPHVGDRELSGYTCVKCEVNIATAHEVIKHIITHIR